MAVDKICFNKIKIFAGMFGADSSQTKTSLISLFDGAEYFILVTSPF
jgi:hypothetical protein